MKAFNFEIYTCNPVTKEKGWDIKFPTIYANSKDEAKEFLKNSYPDFDCIILFNYWMEIKDGTIDAKMYSQEHSYRDTTYGDMYNC